MIIENLQKFKKFETTFLSVLLYIIVLVYAYQYSQIAGKYQPWTTDEFFYYVEAKAIAAHNIYQTPVSLDGNTSYIGDFGFHGISYALKDGWLSKLFFHAQDPPLIFINFLTFLAVLALILLFKPFSINTRLKIALITATHYVLFSFTFSYMQETIQFLFAILALRYLYLMFQNPPPPKKKDAARPQRPYAALLSSWFPAPSREQARTSYLVIIILAITFRYGWFIWGLGLLPLAYDLKSFAKWSAIALVLLLFGIFISRYIMAPYPYNDLLADHLIRAEKFSILNSISLIYQRFVQNLQLFLTPSENIATTCMRYLLLALLIISAWYAFAKRNKFTIACTLIGWTYLIACLTFYFVIGEYDERALAVLNPLLAFSLIGNFNSFIFYPVIAVQLLLFPGVVEATKARNERFIALNAPSSERASREASYPKIKDLITDNQNVVVSMPILFIKHANPNYFVNFPLVTSKGYPIHYKIYRAGRDIRGTHNARYQFTTQKSDTGDDNLVYFDQWWFLYRNF